MKVLLVILGVMFLSAEAHAQQPKAFAPTTSSHTRAAKDVCGPGEEGIQRTLGRPRFSGTTTPIYPRLLDRLDSSKAETMNEQTMKIEES